MVFSRGLQNFDEKKSELILPPVFSKSFETISYIS
jgi:hypothetical protein